MTHPFSNLQEQSVKPWRLDVGLMSRTSADSIDVAICRIKGHGGGIGVELIRYRGHPHGPEVKRQVLRAADLDLLPPLG
jgi:anhydro-N-acetylmuramic acid kinase